MNWTTAHAQYFAYELTQRIASRKNTEGYVFNLQQKPPFAPDIVTIFIDKYAKGYNFL